MQVDDEPTDPGSFKNGIVCDAGRVYGVDFEVVALVASGGMGEVYKVKDRRTGRFHAMKVMRPELARDTALVDRFEKEGIALTRFKHRGVVRAEQVGYDRDIGPYIIMELLEGMTLAELMARYGRRLPAAQAIPILVEVALALELIHQQGIYHRDIKPQNIFLHKTDGQARETKVLDFGAMKARSGSLHFSSTDSGKTIGTPRYMAPEQLVARPVGTFTDVYALGVVAYEILSFSSLFGAEVERANLDEIRMFHLFAERVPLHDVVQDVPPSLWEALERATRREPGDRTRTMQCFADDLKRALSDVVAVEETRAPESDGLALDVVRARVAGRLRAEAGLQRADAPPMSSASGPVDSGPVDSGPVDSGPVDSGPIAGGRAGADRASADPAAPYRATAYGLHLVDLGAFDAAARGAAPADAHAEVAGAQSGEHVVIDVETMLRQRSDLAAKLAAYQKARTELGTLPPLDPVAIRKLLADIDARIAAAVMRQKDLVSDADTRERKPLPRLSNDRSPRRSQPAANAAVLAPTPPNETQSRAAPAAPAAAASVLGHLIGVSGPATLCDLHVGIVPLRLGRDESCQLKLEDEKVSALHATIVRTNEGVFEIVDAESTNGTRVNGRTIQRAVLDVGDRIGIGSSTLEFRLAERKEKPRRRRTVREVSGPVELSSPAVSKHVELSSARSPTRTSTERFAIGGALASMTVLAGVLLFGRMSMPAQPTVLRASTTLHWLENRQLERRAGSARVVGVSAGSAPNGPSVGEAAPSAAVVAPSVVAPFAVRPAISGERR